MGLPVYFNQRFSQNIPLNEQFGYNTSINHLGNIVSVSTYGSGVYIYRSGLNQNLDGWFLESKLTGEKAEDMSVGYFGAHAELNGIGNIAIVSAPLNTGINTIANGTAYIYQKNNNDWSLFQKLTGISGNYQYFGQSLGINYLGDIIAIGSRGNTNSGQVYIYKSGASNWELSRIVTGKPNVSSYANSIALNQSGNILAFGAPYENQNSGKVYVVDWKLPNQIQLSSWELDENSLDINGIYTYQNSISPPSAGVTSGYKHNSLNSWIYFRTGINRWEFENISNFNQWYNSSSDSGDRNILPFLGWRINLAQGELDALTSGKIEYIPKQITGNEKTLRFGIDLDLNNSGNKILIGSLDSDEGSGAAYLFTGNNLNFILSKKFTGDNTGNISQINQAFGNKVSLNGEGDLALISEHKDINTNGFSAGAAYLFSDTGSWYLHTKITGDTDIDYGDNFGFSLALNNSGNVAVIGAIGNGPQYKGAVYVYSDSNIQYSTFLDEPDVIYGQIPQSINCPIQNNSNFLIKLNGENNFSLPYNTKHKFILYKSGENTGYLPLYESNYFTYSPGNLTTYSGIFNSGNYQIKVKSIYNDTNITFPSLCNSGVQVANLIDLSYSNRSGLALFKNSSSVLFKDFLNRNFNLNEVANVYFLDSLDITGLGFTNNFTNFINSTKILEPLEKTKEGVALNDAIDYAIYNLWWNWNNKKKIINIITNNFPYIESDASDCEVLDPYFTNPIEIKYSAFLNKIAAYSSSFNISFNFIYIDKELNDEINKKDFLYNEKELKTLYAKSAQIGNGIFGDNSISPILKSALNLSKTLEQMKLCQTTSSSSSSSIVNCCQEAPVCGFGEYLLVTGFNFIENCGFCPLYSCSGSQPAKVPCGETPSGLYNGDNLSITTDFISYTLKDRLVIWKSGCAFQYNCTMGYSNIQEFVDTITSSGVLLFDSTCIGTSTDPAPNSYPYNWNKISNLIQANNSFNFQSGDLPLGIVVASNCNGGFGTLWQAGIKIQSTGYSENIYINGGDEGYCEYSPVSAVVNLMILDDILNNIYTGDIDDINYLDPIN